MINNVSQMMNNLNLMFNNTFQSFWILFLVIQIVLHLLFAAAVAKDAGLILKQGRTTWLVSGLTWAFATLVGGVFVAAIYWFIHYSNMIRGQNKN